jgi:cytochrome c553
MAARESAAHMETTMRILQSLVAAAALTLVHAGAQAAGDIDAGKAKSATCAACHGADGNGVDGDSPSPGFPIPVLAGQYQDYLARALEDYKSGKRKHPIMAGFAAALSAQDREDLAAYFASQKTSLYTVRYAEDL